MYLYARARVCECVSVCVFDSMLIREMSEPVHLFLSTAFTYLFIYHVIVVTFVGITVNIFSYSFIHLFIINM